MNQLEQVLIAAKNLADNDQTPSIAKLKSQLGQAFPLPIVIKGLQQYQSMSTLARAAIASSQPDAIKTDADKALTLQCLAQQLAAQKMAFEQRITQLEAHITHLNQRLDALVK